MDFNVGRRCKVLFRWPDRTQRCVTLWHDNCYQRARICLLVRSGENGTGAGRRTRVGDPIGFGLSLHCLRDRAQHPSHQRAFQR